MCQFPSWQGKERWEQLGPAIGKFCNRMINWGQVIPTTAQIFKQGQSHGENQVVFGQFLADGPTSMNPVVPDG